MKAETLSEWLKMYRAKHNLTQRYVAKELSISPAFYCRVEQGESVSDDLRQKIISFFSGKLNEQELFRLRCLIDTHNGKISLEGLSDEKKAILLKLASQPLTDKQIQQLKKIAKLEFL